MSSITQDKTDEAYAIHRLDTLLREIAVIVKGAEPPLTKWSYHDLPELVRALASKPAASVVDDALVRDAERWRKHEGSFAVLQAILDAASPLVLNRLKATDAAMEASSGR